VRRSILTHPGAAPGCPHAGGVCCLRSRCGVAGYGSLGLSVEGAHRSDLEMKSKSATEYTLQYKPHEPGVYLLNIKFADEHVAGICTSSTFSPGLVA